MVYYAHSANEGGHWELLADHLRLVSERAAQYAAAFGGAEQARAAGLLHDLGKYADQFQCRLTNPRSVPGRDHWTAGAAFILRCYRHLGRVPALAVQGHHTGLEVLEADAGSYLRSLARVLTDQETVTETDLRVLRNRFDRDGLTFPVVSSGAVPSGRFAADDMLDARMLFSAVVDADYIETEAHFDGNAEQPRKYRPEGPLLDPPRALAAVEAHVGELAAASQANPSVQRMREQLLSACLAAAERPPGLFTLSAPTGSGKTLATLAFALRHAARHGLRRIVLVMPFLSIIDQTACIYRDLFSPDKGFPDNYIIEDHSLADAPREQEQDARDDGQDESHRIRHLLAQNWDAPIILTTNVKCLESLMSNRTSACRKLHRLANSVILFDEVQTLPKDLAILTLGTLSRLSRRFGASVVLATATQPAFEHLHETVAKISQGGWQPVEIVPEAEMTEMFRETAGRVRVRWRHTAPVALDEIADAILREDARQVLCIVNLKRHALGLFQFLKKKPAEGLCHLSTSMCPAHRQAVLADVTKRLKSRCSPPVRLVATQCVEAGVDLDFPVVYRALAPLEAIAQAAGRCNRHGTRPEGGTVHVFLPQADEGKGIYPPGYVEAAQATSVFLLALVGGAGNLDGMEIIQAPERLRAYYRSLYDLTGVGKGATPRERELAECLAICDFARLAQTYRLIAQDSINVLVPYQPDVFGQLREDILHGDRSRPSFLRNWITRARPHTVSVHRPRPDSPICAYLEPVYFARPAYGRDQADWFIALPDLEYSPAVGLVLPDEFPTFA